MSAEALLKLHRSKTGKLALFAAFPEGLYARGRLKGFSDVLKENNCNFTVIGPFGLGLDTSQGYGVVENTFLANPDIEITYNPEEFVTVPADYVKRNNLKSKVTVIGVNALPEILQLVKDGYIDQTTDINPLGQGYTAGKILYDFITKGKTSEEIVILDPISVTKENVDQVINSKK
jgi:ABC-type sugar transport system substrate-binding protein